MSQRFAWKCHSCTRLSRIGFVCDACLLNHQQIVQQTSPEQVRVLVASRHFETYSTHESIKFLEPTIDSACIVPNTLGRIIASYLTLAPLEVGTLVDAIDEGNYWQHGVIFDVAPNLQAVIDRLETHAYENYGASKTLRAMLPMFQYRLTRFPELPQHAWCLMHYCSYGTDYDRWMPMDSMCLDVRSLNTTSSYLTSNKQSKNQLAQGIIDHVLEQHPKIPAALVRTYVQTELHSCVIEHQTKFITDRICNTIHQLWKLEVQRQTNHALKILRA